MVEQHNVCHDTPLIVSIYRCPVIWRISTETVHRPVWKGNRGIACRFCHQPLLRRGGLRQTVLACLLIYLHTMKIKNREILHKKILIVDHSLIVRKMIGFALQGSDYEIIEAADGVDAVRIIYSQPIDLLVTAMNMANINGLELSRIVRETSGLEDLPIIMLTQDENRVLKNEARGVGISLLISKPFSHAQIFNLVKEVLG